MPPIETPSSLTLAQARDLDAADALGAFRSRFQLEPGVTYLDGNSLGPPPRATAARMAEVVSSEWGEGLIRSWNSAGWMQAPTRAGAQIARLIGARPNEVLVADSISVNLFKLLAAGMAREADRTVILTESGSFPTDLYIAQGVASFLPHVEVRAVAREAILDALGDFRAPDILRFGFPALYVRYEDVWTAAEVLHDVLASGAWRDAAFGVRAAVT